MRTVLWNEQPENKLIQAYQESNSSFQWLVKLLQHSAKLKWWLSSKAFKIRCYYCNSFSEKKMYMLNVNVKQAYIYKLYSMKNLLNFIYLFCMSDEMIMKMMSAINYKNRHINNIFKWTQQITTTKERWCLIKTNNNNKSFCIMIPK